MATIAELTARYAWPLSVLPASVKSSDAAKSITDFSNQITLEIGLGFTLFLAALYFPAVTSYGSAAVIITGGAIRKTRFSSRSNSSPIMA